MRDADVVIVGAGAAGLSLADRLCAPPAGRRRPCVLLLDAPPGPLRPPERTWCFWEAPGGPYDKALTASWGRLRVRGRDGTATVGAPAPFRYKMLRSASFERLVGERLSGPGGCRRAEAVVESVEDAPGGARVRGYDAAGRPLELRARWVFDSRPPARLPAARTTLLQHFHGWFVTTEAAAFDPAVADLMDFRTPQPAHGMAFGYVLPLGPREALVEYTEFSAAVIGADEYDAALRRYTGEVLGLGPFRVTDVEQGQWYDPAYLKELVAGAIPVTIAEGESLIDIANAARRILQVGHLERFNAAVQAVQPRLSVPRFSARSS